MNQVYEFTEKSVSIVIIGGFNPLNLTPEWLYNFGLISKDDLNKSQIKIFDMNQLLVDFSWFSIDVIPAPANAKKLILTLTEGSSLLMFQDLISSIIALNDTVSMSALGLNFRRFIKHKKTKEWHQLGDRLAPKEDWANAFSDEPHHIGLRGMSMMIDHIVESVEKLENGAQPVLNIEFQPKPQTIDSKENLSFIDLNYHFPLNPKNCVNMIQKTLECYLEVLNNEIDRRINTLLVGE